MRRNILLIDSEEEIQRLLTARLRVEGYYVASATCAEEALFMLGEEPFGLIILDLLISGPTRFGFVRQLKRAHPRIPVLILTGMDYEEDILQAARAAGADGYVSKLDHIENLIADIHRLLQASTAPHAVEPNHVTV